MLQETRQCQNCKNPFVIEPDDFDFYAKIKVPPPTFCPWCRFIRRLTWRNEKTLYKRACDLCKQSIIAMYPASAPFPVYCRECWYSDKWEAAAYGRDYDFSRPFFAQFADLLKVVPRLALWQRNVVDSEFSNMIGECKNVYLSTSVVAGSENVAYSKGVDTSFNIFDCYGVAGSDGCYENIEGDKNYNSHYLMLSRNCIDSRFLVDCANCRNCILSSNLRNKEFYIRNKQYSKDDYFRELARFDFGNRTTHEALLGEFGQLRGKALYKFANILKSTDSTGNNLRNVKNGKDCFDVYDAENAKYCYRAFTLKDSMDFTFGIGSELMYEYSTGAQNDYNVRFSFSAMMAVQNAEYVEYCMSCSNIFGCISLRNKENAILNKSYSPDEYAALRERIIAHMNEMPYRDAGSREYRYGEFFPVEISPFGYNETLAQDLAPLTKRRAMEAGYRWQDPEEKARPITMAAAAIPQTVADATDAIQEEVLGCAHEGKCEHRCTVAFRLIPDEVRFYKKHSIPIPNRCPNCRYYERVSQVPPFRLWSRQCMCDYSVHPNNSKHEHHLGGRCSNTFETSYTPDRKEIVYCEQCYNAEVV